MTREEIWLKINDWDYEISNQGRMRSLPRTTEQYNAKAKRIVSAVYKGNLLKPGKEPRYNKTADKTVYYHSYRMSNGSKIKKVLVHQVVCKYFIPNPNNKPHINHIDENPENNTVSNLEWCTRSENELHKYKNGYRQVQSKFTPEQVRELRESNKSYTDIAKEYNISVSNVGKMMNYKSYKNVKEIK